MAPVPFLILFLPGIDRFVRLRLYERMSVAEAMTQLKLSHCSWLRPWPRSTGACADARVRHYPACESIKQAELASEFIYWLFASVVIPLVRVSFTMLHRSPRC